jgi:thiol:disulfide interchange protein DsbC
LGRKLHLTGTPTIYFADGSRSATGFDAGTLEARLAGAGSKPVVVAGAH